MEHWDVSSMIWVSMVRNLAFMWKGFHRKRMITCITAIHHSNITFKVNILMDIMGKVLTTAM